MANCFVGDVQGCYDDLRRLLDLAKFDPTEDTLWLCGDLVARGPDSLSVLRFVKSLGERAVTVLGNHDLHLLAVAGGHATLKKKDKIEPIIKAPDAAELLDWLRFQPLLAEHPEHPLLMVHAGLSPAWDVTLARQCAREVESLLQGEQYQWLLKHMYGDHPDSWSNELTGIERYRYIINVFTRMRFCYFDGRLDFKCKLGPKESTPGLRPWFEQREHHVDDPIIVFGHWAALMGQCAVADIKALDTGCVWGNSLTLWRYEDDALIATPCPVHAK
ncbi:symmetrical bis(5'-nucleosyl)-tetraphosphatase [Aeromonas simiae]|uniref:symmetrical bis(5'-nucleosyl)-tetraphosphatase n=1 Tax=Aeromonas simiae TaxID=218936 RepID=UPI0005A69488|nr:symmetrical bis(5'-nucleosyl)-tetraphosphatase [Aeromonas simiae]